MRIIKLLALTFVIIYFSSDLIAYADRDRHGPIFLPQVLTTAEPGQFYDTYSKIMISQDRTITLVTDSGGGEVRLGYLIIDAMRIAKSLNKNIVAVIRQWSASMAAVINCYADEVILDEGAMLYFHPARAYLVDEDGRIDTNSTPIYTDNDGSTETRSYENGLRQCYYKHFLSESDLKAIQNDHKGVVIMNVGGVLYKKVVDDN